ncbi:MAG TPA: Holliday junction resolvase RuvX [Fimbriimonadaceae bacterium]|nr:Holliday junction resolvase RuvX [Fimbriimonadaceae bacterium]
MRLLGVDFGFKRIGLAVAETDPAIVTARPSLAASGTLAVDAQRLVEIARKEDVSEIVVGLPIEEDGQEGRMARICRTLAGHVRESGIPVALVDETLTSVEAERNLKIDSGLKGSQIRKLKDGEAARLILERRIAQMSQDMP